MNRKLFWISVIMGGAFIGTAFFATVVVLNWRRPVQVQETKPSAYGDTSIQAGFFTVSQSPGNITIKRGDTKSISVKIIVIPLESALDNVTFYAGDVFKDGISVKEQNVLRAEIVGSGLAPKDFNKGITLTITPSKRISAGPYVISYRVQSSKVKKDFIVPVKVE